MAPDAQDVMQTLIICHPGRTHLSIRSANEFSGDRPVDIDFDHLTEDELLRLNRRIVARLKFLESLHAHAEMLRFEVGQQVSFQPPGRDRQVGILVKYNKKAVTVLTDAGQRWNVSPHLLSPVKEVRRGQSGRGDVIDINSKR